MAAKDFRAGQVETSKLILSGGIANSTVGLAIYSGSKASNRSGGVTDSAMLTNAGEDVGIFISGSTSYTNRSSENTNVLFGGNLSTSGSMHFMNPATPVSASVVLTFTNAPTATQSIQFLAAGDASGTTFTCTASTTSASQFGRNGSKHGADNLKTAIEASSLSSKLLVSAVEGSDPYTITITQVTAGAVGNTPITSNLSNVAVGSASPGTSGFFTGGSGLPDPQQTFIFADHNRVNHLYLSGTLYASGSSDSAPYGTISGSIHKTRDGLDYLKGTGGITISSASNGQVTIDGGGAGGGSEWTDNGGPGGVLHPADNSGIQHVVVGGTTTSGADIILYSNGAATFNEQGTSDATFRVELSSGYQGAILVDENGIGPKVSLGTKAVAKTSLSDEARGQDVLILLSGSTGTRNTTNPGVTLNAGELVSSGSITSLSISGGAISGSITQTKEGKSYLVAGKNVQITSGSNGQIEIESSFSDLLYTPTGALTFLSSSYNAGFDVVSQIKSDAQAAPIIYGPFGSTGGSVGPFAKFGNSVDYTAGGFAAIIFNVQVPQDASNISFTMAGTALSAGAASSDVEFLVAGRKFVDAVALNRGNTINTTGHWLGGSGGTAEGDFSSGWKAYTRSTPDQTHNKFTGAAPGVINIENSQPFSITDLINNADRAASIGDSVISVAIARNRLQQNDSEIGTSADTYDGDYGVFWIRVKFS